MSNIEHYFENILYHGFDETKNDVNKQGLSKSEQTAVEICALYVMYSLFYNREDFDNFLKEHG